MDFVPKISLQVHQVDQAKKETKKKSYRPKRKPLKKLNIFNKPKDPKILKMWDRSGETIRIRMLREFYQKFKEYNYHEMEVMLGSNVILLYTRFLTYLRLSYLHGRFLSLKMKVITLFLESQKALIQFIEVGGTHILTDILLLLDQYHAIEEEEDKKRLLKDVVETTQHEIERTLTINLSKENDPDYYLFNLHHKGETPQKEEQQEDEGDVNKNETQQVNDDHAQLKVPYTAPTNQDTDEPDGRSQTSKQVEKMLLKYINVHVKTKKRAEQDQFQALTMLLLIAKSGRRYKELICDGGVYFHHILKSIHFMDQNPTLLQHMKILVLELAKGNPKEFPHIQQALCMELKNKECTISSALLIAELIHELTDSHSFHFHSTHAMINPPTSTSRLPSQESSRRDASETPDFIDYLVEREVIEALFRFFMSPDDKLQKECTYLLYLIQLYHDESALLIAEKMIYLLLDRSHGNNVRNVEGVAQLCYKLVKRHDETLVLSPIQTLFFKKHIFLLLFMAVYDLKSPTYHIEMMRHIATTCHWILKKCKKCLPDEYDKLVERFKKLIGQTYLSKIEASPVFSVDFALHFQDSLVTCPAFMK